MSKDTAALFLPGLNSSQQLVARRLFQLRLDEPMSPLQCESFFFRVLRLCSKAKPDAKDSRSNSERVNHGVVKGVEESKLENFLSNRHLFPKIEFAGFVLDLRKGSVYHPKFLWLFRGVCFCAVTKRPWIWWSKSSGSRWTQDSREGSRVQWFLQPNCQRWWKKRWEKFSNNHEVKEVIQSLKKVWLSISAFLFGVWGYLLEAQIISLCCLQLTVQRWRGFNIRGLAGG